MGRKGKGKIFINDTKISSLSSANKMYIKLKNDYSAGKNLYGVSMIKTSYFFW